MRFLILAVSYKYGGLCVAGLNLDNLEFVRIGYPNGIECGAIPSWDFKWNTSGREFQLNVLDVIDIDATKMVNNGCQTENYLLNNINNYLGKFDIDDIDTIYKSLDKKQFIFLNNYDYVNIKDIDRVNYSLQLAKVDNLTVSQYTNSKGVQKLQAHFEYAGNKYYNIRVTDCVFSAYPNCYGNVQKICINQNAYIMVSLPYDEWSKQYEKFYKYVSGIILV